MTPTWSSLPCLLLCPQRSCTSQLIITFVATANPQVTMDPQWQQKIEQDIKEAQETALPEDDEDL